MKKVLKITAVTVILLILWQLLVKHEVFLERHYDTLENRNRKQSTFFGVTISESIELKKGGYRAEYDEIYDQTPQDDRWHSISRYPVRTTHLFVVDLRSVATPRGISRRNEIAKRIFERYSEARDPDLARQAFVDLEKIIPHNEAHRITNFEELDSILNAVKTTPSLQGLFARNQQQATDQTQ